MNRITILAGFLAFAFSCATFAYPLPKNFCYQGCSSEQKEIWERFEQSTSFDSTRQAQVYSGACYHLTSLYQNDQAHYAGVLIDRSAKDELTFSGLFSFFAPNKYSSWDLKKARATFQKRHTLEVENSEAFVDLNPGGDTLMYYWFRDQPQTGNLLLIAMWGVGHQVFCELTPNEGAF